jgi:Flp pilus assembly protein TadD
VLIEAAGQVEFVHRGATNWQRASVGLPLEPGARVRTLGQSRAAVQLSDRSILRLDEHTTLEILPPRGAEKRRFGLPGGSIFFFNREKPADVEFDTPIAAGAIRGTEFLLEVAEPNPALRLALIDGRVALRTATAEINLEHGEEVRLQPGQPPQRSTVVNVPATIQWALYYPAVLNPDELALAEADARALSTVLARYRAGDLLGALAAWPAQEAPETPGAAVLHAALDLAVGDVPDAERSLATVPGGFPPANALRELLATVQGQAVPTKHLPATSSELLARTYTLQARANLSEARSAARKAVELAPGFGLAHARLAELEFAFGARGAALAQLQQALALSPDYAPAHALQGFVLLKQGRAGQALAALDHARALDSAFGPAWLGRGLCLMRERQFPEARASFQAAAALELQRSLFRSYLGKADAEIGESKAAEKELNLAKRLDENDPTAWLYSALALWQENRINDAIRDLEGSLDRNDQRAVFRSRMLLDADRSVRSADLAAIYNDAGFPDVARHTAARSVAEDYANFSGHLFLANSYQTLEDPNRFNLRFETARQSELLMANLLAPPGGGNLSQVLSQQEHLRYFDPRPFGFSSLTEYASRGDWRQAATAFGTVDGFSYALDVDYRSLNGWRANNDSENQQYALTVKQRISSSDDLYLQAGWLKFDAGDVAARYSPSNATLGFRVEEKQEPTLYAGWHHEWSPGIHTLLLGSRLDDTLSYTNPEPNVLFLRRNSTGIIGIEDQFLQPFRLDFQSDLTLYSVELQQILENERFSLVLGGRLQSGDGDVHANLAQQPLAAGFQVFSNDQHLAYHLERGDAYAYGSWQVFQPLRLVAGVTYDHITFPENTDVPPLSSDSRSRELVGPKAGFLFAPWERGLLRAAYTRSLGGLFFDNSVRLEPTQVAGFNQAFRSLIPESVKGLVPGAEFETAGAAFDQSFASGTWFGVEAEWLTSHGTRTVGVLTNSIFFIPIPDSPSSTQDSLDFRERDLSAYASQLLGRDFALSARYRLSEATLDELFPDVPLAAQTGQHKQAILQQVSLGATFNHPSGIFAQWESSWYHQTDSGYNPALATSDFWQHNAFVGYRFPRRYAEIRVGVLNIFNQDYQLNPLNLQGELPRARTFVASLRLNF